MQPPQIRTVIEGLHGTALHDKALENALSPICGDRLVDDNRGRQQTIGNAL